MDILNIAFSIIWYYVLYKVLKRIFNFCYLLYRHLIRKPLDLPKRYGEGTWVMVTGATDGIGKGFCVEFAKLGFNIILVSRTLNKLKTVAEELKTINNKISTKVIEFDFSKLTTLEDYKKIFTPIIDEYDISVLVNNVGFSDIKKFKYLTGLETQDMINLNIVPQALLSDMLIKKMIQRNANTGLKSCIINLSSFASQIQSVKFVQYHGCKAFNNVHSKLMSYELKDDNIDVMSIKPMFVASPLTKMEPNWYHVISVQQLMNHVMKQIGHDSETFGHLLHEITARVVLSIPNFLLRLKGVNNEWTD